MNKETTTIKSGTELIAEERQRQIKVEGWSDQHDEEHDGEELAFAAICYAMPHTQRESEGVSVSVPHDYWPWYPEWWKPTPENRIKELVKAGALIAAEIDRLQNIPKK